jgi:hypothetical protein
MKPAVFTFRTREIVTSLAEVLDAGVALCDGEKRRINLWRGAVGEGISLDWRVVRGAADDFATHAGVCHAEAPVNDRWTLVVWRAGFLHADARALVAWAAKRLEGQLSELTSAEPVPPAGGGGGPGGGAELAIPVWWARRAQADGTELALR